MARTAFAVVLSGTGAGACGVDAGSSSAPPSTATVQPSALTPAEAVAKAAEKTVGTTSLRYRIAGTVPDRGRLTAEASMVTKPSAMSMQLTTADQRAEGPLEVRFVGKALYLGGSALDDSALDDSALGGEKGGLDGSALAVARQELAPRRAGGLGPRGAGQQHLSRAAPPDRGQSGRAVHVPDRFQASEEDRDRDRRRHPDCALQSLKPVIGDPIDLTFTFLEINEPVTVRTPPAGDTADLAALVDTQAG
ncbi:hypothetical protein ACH4Y0_35605 [Streptomyces sp. NPDC020707]|uniref:hypothetical protein n=1 Tax=Streptomyces sp. NPDC020707 TaxID=3365084 RepID=UPI0037A4C587